MLTALRLVTPVFYLEAYQRTTGTTNPLWILFVVMLTLCVSCERKAAQPQTSVNTQSLSVPAEPQRIVSLAPNLTEIVFALGAGNRLVGVTRYCDYPKEALKITKVGGLIDPDTEAILTLKPDLVIGVTSSGDPAITRVLDQAKISYVFLRMESLEETFDGIRHIGKILGGKSKAQGEALAADMREALKGLDGLALKDRPSVLMVYGRKPIIAAGPGTFSHDLLIRAGGRNVLESDQNWPTLDLEKVIALNPDRILDFSMSQEAQSTFWDEIPGLSAVESHNVYHFDDPSMMRPGPRIVDAYRRIALAIRGKSHAH